MLKTAADKGLPSWFIVHRRELINQSMRAFQGDGVNFGVVAASYLDDPRPLVQICSVQTLANRFGKLRRPRLIIYDECHHIAAGSWSKIFKSFPDAFHIGLTATPARLDGAGLGSWFKEMISGPSVRWLIENGYLSQYRLFAPSTVNMTGVHTRMGDFVRSESEAAVNKPTITGDAIREYQSRASGKRAVVFCVSVKHSKHVVEQFQAAGISAEHVDGETESRERDAAIRRFESGRTLVLSNVELFGEGFDLPAIECGILLRPTQSLGMYLQQVGRVLRPSPGKAEAVILDHAGNCQRHGLPDQEREWSLAGNIQKRGRDSDNGPSVRVCEKCFAAQLPGRNECTYCRHPFAIKSRHVAHEEGDLIEITRDVLQEERDRYGRQKEQGEAQTEADLIAIGKQRGYKRPSLWARHIIMARRRKGRVG